LVEGKIVPAVLLAHEAK